MPKSQSFLSTSAFINFFFLAILPKIAQLDNPPPNAPHQYSKLECSCGHDERFTHRIFGLGFNLACIPA